MGCLVAVRQKRCLCTSYEHMWFCRHGRYDVNECLRSSYYKNIVEHILKSSKILFIHWQLLNNRYQRNCTFFKHQRTELKHISNRFNECDSMLENPSWIKLSVFGTRAPHFHSLNKLLSLYFWGWFLVPTLSKYFGDIVHYALFFQIRWGTHEWIFNYNYMSQKLNVKSIQRKTINLVGKPHRIHYTLSEHQYHLLAK